MKRFKACLLNQPWQSNIAYALIIFGLIVLHVILALFGIMPYTGGSLCTHIIVFPIALEAFRSGIRKRYMEQISENAKTKGFVNGFLSWKFDVVFGLILLVMFIAALQFDLKDAFMAYVALIGYGAVYIIRGVRTVMCGTTMYK